VDKWIEVDFNKLRQNFEALRNFIKVPIMAVLKQNAYGLGAVPVGNFLERLGIKFFAVTHIHEGVELRNGGVRSPILVFAPSTADQAEVHDLWRYDLTPSVYSLECAEILHRVALELDRPISVHVKIDTGMGRMGFAPEEILAAAERLQELGGLRYEGIYTHYSNAFEKIFDYTKRQKDSFLQLVNRLEDKGLTFSIKHSANSTAALKFPETHMDMVRIGSALLGNGTLNARVPLTRAYRFRVRVLQVRRLKSGSFVGYSNTHRVKRDTNVAVLPIGYTDGFGVQKKIDSFRFVDFLREQYHLIKTFIKPEHSVFYEGKSLKVLGKTSMQLTVVEVGDLPIKPGDVVDVSLNPLLAGARLERVCVGQALKVGGDK
jgi:alanine racemase